MDKAAAWMRQGMSPRRLALTLALGFAIGCFPLLGLTTGLCVLVALVLRLNMPAIQLANWAAMPMQLALLFPFVRLGGWIVDAPRQALLHGSPLKMLAVSAKMAGEALVGWVVIAAPVVILLTFGLTVVLRRIPVLAAAESGD